MPMNSVTMWGMFLVMAIGAAAQLMSQGSLFGSVRDAYPSDPAKRYALHHCAEMDSQFSRWSVGDREICYRAVLPASARASSNGATQ